MNKLPNHEEDANIVDFAARCQREAAMELQRAFSAHSFTRLDHRHNRKNAAAGECGTVLGVKVVVASVELDACVKMGIIDNYRISVAFIMN